MGRFANGLVLLALLGVLSGCGDFEFKPWNPFEKKELPPEPSAERARERDPVLAETVGAYTLVSAADSLRLRGFGLVVGLGDRGSSDCPTSVRDYLVDYFRKEFAPLDGAGVSSISPDRLIDSSDTAVVEIIGDIKSGARRGHRFDVQVSALGAETRSLEGGVLLPAELKIFQATPRGVIAGRPLARASGSIFTNPFGNPTGGERGVRRGFVLGGGRTLDERSARLLLEEPSYSMARRIERRINERFGQRPAAAEAMSRGYVDLNTPDHYNNDPEWFLDLVLHLQLENSPEYLERRIRDLRTLVNGDAQRLEHLSLIWEGIGRNIITEIQPLYEADDPLIRYYAARAGLRLGDVNALGPMAAVSTSSGHSHQILAVRELGRARVPGTTERLAALLNVADQQIRVAAYEELVDRGYGPIRSEPFASAADPRELNFILDLVPSDGRPLVYVRRTGQPRLAIFGGPLKVQTPLFYRHPLDWVTLDTADGGDEITVLARGRTTGRFAPPFQVPAEVSDLVRALAFTARGTRARDARGLGLPYSVVVQVLSGLEDTDSIAAPVVIEERSVTELLGPAESGGRPEAEAPPSRRREAEAPDGDPDLPARENE